MGVDESERHPTDGWAVLPFASEQAFECWLDANHADEAGLWVKFAKKGSGIASIRFPEALAVAMCFGWVDSKMHRYDDDYYLLRYQPRRSRSTWSARNKELVERLIVADLRMASLGASGVLYPHAQLCLRHQHHKAFSVRCRSAIDLGHAVLPGHRWLSNRRGVATVVACPGTEVHGVLWALSGRDLAALDLFEGVNADLYMRTLKQIRLDGTSEPCWSWVYQATDEAPGEPRQPYIEAIVNAAIRRRFPRKYVHELRAWAAGAAPALNQERAYALPALLSG